MTSKVVRYAFVYACGLLLALGPLPQPVLSQTAEVTGTVAGRVYDRTARTALEGVVVTAHRITTNQRFTSQATDARGSYLVSEVPAGIYAFYLSYQGTEYRVDGHLDARFSMSFLIETCFVLDAAAKSAFFLRECKSGLYADTQVVTIGPHRFFDPKSDLSFQGTPRTPQPPPAQQPPATQQPPASTGQQPPPAPAEPAAQEGLEVTHAGLQCLARDLFPLLLAAIKPGANVQNCRVYFRAAQYPEFYYVEMTGTGTGEDNFQAVLPKPSPDTNQVIYYIEAVDKSFENHMTEEYAPEVTEEEECRRRDPGAAYFPGETPSIIVGATVQGIPAIPLGFQAAGIGAFVSATGVVTSLVAGAAAGGAAAGLGTTGLVLIVAGSTAAATGVVVTVTGEEEASPVK